MRVAVPAGRRTVAGLALGASLVALTLVTPAAVGAAAEGQDVAVETPDAAVGEVPAGEWPAGPAVTATSYVLLDAETGQALAERAADDPRPVASTIKILTALAALERVSVDEVVTVGEEVRGLEGASVGLRPGDRWTVEQLLDAVIVRSGNEAAVALAVHVAGSLEAFLRLMEADARARGIDVPELVSVNGLDDRNRLSARQLGQLTRAALSDDRFREIAAQRSVQLPGRGIESSRNLLLDGYAGATGVKTGYTQAAGWSVVASAERDGRELVAVVLDSRSDGARFEDAAALLDHGFEGFERVEAAVDLRLRQAGRWIDLEGPRVPLLVPASDPQLTFDQPLPVDVPDGPVTVTAAWHGSELATLTGTPAGAERPPVSDGAAIGRFLLDRAYAAMRATTRAEAWTR